MAETFDPMDFSNPLIDVAPAGGIWETPVGPQADGTYQYPTTAQQVNSPQNTAGYSSAISPQVAQLFSQGIGALSNLGIAKMQVDYARAAATNGGLFLQGRYAGVPLVGRRAQQMDFSMLLLIGGLAYLLLKD